MRIVIPTTGSQGDVRPYVALGAGLQAAGHRVRVATHADFAPLVSSRGLDFFPIEDGARALHETEAGRKMLAAGGNPLTFMRHFAEMRKPLLARLMARCLDACRDADLVLVGTTAFLPGLSVAEKLGRPAIPVHLLPTGPNRALANCLLPEAPAWLPGRGLYNWLSHLFVGEFFWQCLGNAVNRARRDVLGLPPWPPLGPPLRVFEEGPILYGYSTLVVPKPPDLGANHAVTGYWLLGRRPGWQPPPGLEDFLAAGPPPVCVGFGSMRRGSAEEITDLVKRALVRCGRRGVLLTGWGGLGHVDGSDQLFAAESVPHDWLFPRVAAVVHHGGAGTTAAALRAGVPSVVVPFMADQPFWARRVVRLGVGPESVPRQRLTAEGLARAIRTAVSDTGMRARAAELGRKLRAEDGVATAVEVFHRWVEAPALAPREICRPARRARFGYGLPRATTFLPQSVPNAGQAPV